MMIEGPGPETCGSGGSDPDTQHCLFVSRLKSRRMSIFLSMPLYLTFSYKLFSFLGAQIERTTNHEAMRDLSGRRQRDVNKEARYGYYSFILQLLDDSQLPYRYLITG
jgi:hypothetical protein